MATTTTGYVIRKGRITSTNPKSRLGKAAVSFVRVGRTVVFTGPADRLPKDVRAAALAHVGL